MEDARIHLGWRACRSITDAWSSAYALAARGASTASSPLR